MGIHRIHIDVVGDVVLQLWVNAFLCYFEISDAAFCYVTLLTEREQKSAPPPKKKNISKKCRI